MVELPGTYVQGTLRSTPRTAPTAQVICGDVIDVLDSMPTASVHTIITSPPYYGLRNYGIPPRRWSDGSECVLGLEPTLADYLDHLTEVFQHAKRVLRPEGTLWLNLGDCYAGGGKHEEKTKYAEADAQKPKRRKQRKLTGKDLLMVPARAALALQEPYYTGQLKRESDQTWMAAFVDSEGCITIIHTHGGRKKEYQSFPTILAANVCDHELITRASTLVSGGRVNGPYPTHNGNRDSYKWRLVGIRAANVIAEIYPHLVVKRKQAIVAWNHEQERQSYGNKAVPKESWIKQAQCCEMIQALNKRRSVDIPHWMKEPPQPEEPGWILRQDQIWAKGLSFCATYSGSVMPESTRDRTTWAHEHVFHLAQDEDYFYDQDGCREPYAASTIKQATGRAYAGHGQKNYAGAGVQNPSDVKRRVIDAAKTGTGRNLRNVWVVGKQSFKGAHFATFPEALVDPIIRVSTSAHGCCPVCGVQWERNVLKEALPPDIKAAFEAARGASAGRTGRDDGHTQRKPNYVRKVLGETWLCNCEHEALAPIPATVLDIFGGSQRCGLAAVKLGRNYIGIDVNPEYCAMGVAALREAGAEIV